MSNPNQAGMSQGPGPEAFRAPAPVEQQPVALPAEMMTQAVEAAAVRREAPAQTSHRADYWKPPTDAQIENAAKYGFDLQKHKDKYY